MAKIFALNFTLGGGVIIAALGSAASIIVLLYFLLRWIYRRISRLAKKIFRKDTNGKYEEEFYGESDNEVIYGEDYDTENGSDETRSQTIREDGHLTKGKLLDLLKYRIPQICIAAQGDIRHGRTAWVVIDGDRIHLAGGSEKEGYIVVKGPYALTLEYLDVYFDRWPHTIRAYAAVIKFTELIRDAFRRHERTASEELMSLYGYIPADLAREITNNFRAHTLVKNEERAKQLIRWDPDL